MFTSWFGHHGWMFQGDSWWIGVVAMLVHLLFWVAIVFLIVHLIKNTQIQRNNSTGVQDRSNIIIKERYAKGEITFDEYNRLKEELE